MEADMAGGYALGLACSGVGMVLSVPACRCLAVCLVFNLVVMITTRFYESLNLGRLVTVLNVLDYLIFPAMWILLLAPRMGADGAWYTFILAEVTTLAVMYGLLAAKLKKGRFTLEEWIQFGQRFDVAADDRLDATLYGMDDVIGISEYVQRFCAGHGMDRKTAAISALAVEEMAGNIVQHGFHKDEKKHAVDIRVLYAGDRMVIRLRDDCRPFDPRDRIELVHPDDPVKNVGIRMIAGLCQEMTYQELFRMNVTTIIVAARSAAADRG